MPQPFYTLDRDEALTAKGIGTSTIATNLVYREIPVRGSGDASGTRDMTILQYGGGVDNNNIIHYRYTAMVGWEALSSVDDASIAEAETEMLTLPSYGLFVEYDDSEITAIFAEVNP